MTSDQNTKRITLALDLHIQPWHKRTYRVSLGALVEEGPKGQAVERVKERALAALQSADVGAVVRVGIADGFVYVLSCAFDGTYQISGFHPRPGEIGSSTELHMRTFEPGKRIEAVDYFGTFVEGRHDRARKGAADADASLRELARKAGVSDDGEFEDVAQRLGLAYAAAHRREEQAAQGDRAAALFADIVAAGSSIEGAALARLLGLRSDVSATVLRRTATEIVASSRAGKYAGTLKDLREWVGGHDAVETVDLAVTKLSEEAEKFTLEEAEEKIVESDWVSTGPLDKAIAESIKDDSLPSLAKAALLDKYREKPDFDDEDPDYLEEQKRQELARITRLVSAGARRRELIITRAAKLTTRRFTASSEARARELEVQVERLRTELRHRLELPEALRRELGL